jgi:hypothetical protein
MQPGERHGLTLAIMFTRDRALARGRVRASEAKEFPCEKSSEGPSAIRRRRM